MTDKFEFVRFPIYSAAVLKPVIEAAVLAERTACAQLCDTAQKERHGSIHNAEYCANSIRARKDD